MTDDNIRHDDITHSTFLHPQIRCIEDLIDWGLTHLGQGLQTVELTRKMIEYCVQDAIEKYTKFASFQTEDLVVSLQKYDDKEGLDLTEYNIADVHDISFQRDTLLHGFGNDMFFGQYAMLNGYAGAGIFPFSGYGGLGSSAGSWVSLHNLHEHFEMINRVTGSMPQYRYSHTTKHLKIVPKPKRKDHNILITAEIEPSPEELYGNEYVKRLFLALLKIQLGIVRKKFSSVQLIGGGQIDTSIGDEGKEEFDKAMEELRSSESNGNIWLIG